MSEQSAQLETSSSERPPLTGLSPEQEKQEAERWYQRFVTTPERQEKLKADFRLEQILILTENQELRSRYIEKLLAHIEHIATQDQEISYEAEFASIHAILTIGETLKQGASEDLVEQYAPRLYRFSHIPNSVISGMAHQQFLNILGSLSQKRQKRKLLKLLEN